VQAIDSMDTTSYAAGPGIAPFGAPAWAELEREIADEAAALRHELGETKRQIAELGPLAELGELVAFVAHEVRNPLAGIAATAEVLRDSLEPAEQGAAGFHGDAVEGLNVILDEAARLDRTVRNLLDFARSRQSRVRPCDLAAEVGRLAQAIAAEGHADEAGVAVRVELADEPPLVLADPELLQHAFSNLATNAIQAMQPGGTLTIRALEPEADSDYACVEFADTGCGIPAEDLPKIFDPFFTTRTGGVGLGLAAASKLMEHLGGSITVESEPGRGSRFAVWLRRAAAALTMAGTEARS